MAKRPEKRTYTLAEAVEECCRRSSDEEEAFTQKEHASHGSSASSVDSDENVDFLEGKDPEFEM